MRRIEHLSSKHDSPRGSKNGYEDEDEDYRKTQELINQAQSIMEKGTLHARANTLTDSSSKGMGKPPKKKDSSFIMNEGANLL